MSLDPLRYFPADPAQRRIAAELFATVEKLPIISPHGHTDPAWFAHDQPFEDAVSLLLWPDHYLLRMLHSAGVSFESIGIVPRDGVGVVATDPPQVLEGAGGQLFHLPRHALPRLAGSHIPGSVRSGPAVRSGHGGLL